MKKENLLKPIEKATLGTDEGKVLIKVTDETISVHNVVDKYCQVRTIVNSENFKMEDVTIPLPDYKQFTNILKSLDDEVELTVTKSSINISDSASDVFYGLGSATAFKDYATERPLKIPPTPTATFELNKEFIERFLKSKGALGTNIFGVQSNQSNLEFTLNYSPTQNKNKIVLTVGADVTTQIFDTICFNADAAASIFAANKDFDTGTIQLYTTSSSSLLLMQFKGDGWDSTYGFANSIVS